VSGKTFSHSLANGKGLLENMRLKLGLLSVVFVLSYFSAFSLLVNTWLSRDDYSHGFLVPLISFYFVWMKRHELQRIPIIPNLPGGLLISIVGSCMLLVGGISSVAIIQQLSILVIIPGMVLLLLGKDFLKALALPLGYLILMVPVLDIVLNRIQWPFQLFSAILSTKLLNLINIPVFRSVNFLELPNITLEIAEVCSGVKYLVSIVAIGIPLAYFTQKLWWRRILVLSTAVLIGILVNGFRVALIGIWAYNGGEVVHGPLHIFQGLFVSVVGFIFLFLTVYVFSKIFPLDNQETKSRQNILSGKFSYDAKQFNRAWLCAIIVLSSLTVYLYTYSPKEIPLKRDLTQLPLNVGQWKGRQLPKRDMLLEAPGADVNVARVYRSASGREIMFYLGYFETQKQEKELISYKLGKLYRNVEEMEILANVQKIRVNKTIFNEDRNKYLALYWYDLNGRIVANRYMAKLVSAFYGLINNRTNGAIVVLYGKLSGTSDEAKLIEDEKDFAQQLFPLLVNFLPSGNENINTSGRIRSEDQVMPSSTGTDFKDALDKLSGKKIFFGHQSVGLNIVEGINDINHRSNNRLNILKTKNPDSFETPVFAHSTIGFNTDPISKVDEFVNLMEGGIGNNADYAFLKFCFVDITAETDIKKLFEYYKKRFEGLTEKYPKTTFIHMTVPLTTVQDGPKAFIKKIIGRPIGGYEDNYKRYQFNEMIKKEYANSYPVFDLARIESTDSNGSSLTFKRGGETFYGLIPSYTYDGSHLNETGRLVVARELLSFLATK